MNLNDNIMKHNILNALKPTDSPIEKSKKPYNNNNTLTNDLLLNKIPLESSLNKNNDLSFNNTKNLKFNKFQAKLNDGKNKILKIPDNDKEKQENAKNKSFIGNMNNALINSNNNLSVNNNNIHFNNNISKKHLNKQEATLDKTFSTNISKQILYDNNSKINLASNDKFNKFMKSKEKYIQGNNQYKMIKTNAENFKQILSKKNISNLKSKFTNKSYSELLTSNFICNESLLSTVGKDNQNQQNVYGVLKTTENLTGNDNQTMNSLVNEDKIKNKYKSVYFNSLNQNMNFKSKKFDLNSQDAMLLDFQKQTNKVEDNNNNSKQEIEQQLSFNESVQKRNYNYSKNENNNNLLNNDNPSIISKKEILKKRKNSKNKINESLRKIDDGYNSINEAKFLENNRDRPNKNNFLIQNYIEYKSLQNLDKNCKKQKKINLYSKNNLTLDYTHNSIKENFGISNDFAEESLINDTIIKKELNHNKIIQEYVANNDRSMCNMNKFVKNINNGKAEKEIKLFDIKTENTEDEVLLNVDDFQCENFDFIEYSKEKNFELNSSNDLIDFNQKRFTDNNNTNDDNKKKLKNNEHDTSSNDFAYGVLHNNKYLWTQSSYLPNNKYLDFINEEFLNLNTHNCLNEKNEFKTRKHNYLFTDSELNINSNNKFLNKKNMKLFFHKKEKKFINNTFKNELEDINELEKKSLSDFKVKSASNLAKNPLINKHIGSRILTLNSDNEEKSENSDENESSIIDSDYFEENQKREKSKSKLGKNSLKKLDLSNKTLEKLTPDDKQNFKLNYHKKKNSNLEGNSGGLTAKYLAKKDLNKSKKKYNEGNLFKKFSLWKTIDNEITNNNFEDINKTLKIMHYFIQTLKKEFNLKETQMKLKIDILEKENLNLRLENKTLHQEIKNHKSTIYNIYKRSIDFEHNKIIEDKEIILTINKLLKENEFLRKILNNGDVYSNNKNYEDMLNRLLNNPLALLNNLNFDEKINSMILNNKHLLKRTKSEDSIKIIQSEDKKQINKNYVKLEHQNENFNSNNFICEIDSADNNIEYDVKDLISLKNIGNLVNISNNINPDLFNQKFLTKSSRNFNKENLMFAEKFNINYKKNFNKDSFLLIEKKSSRGEKNEILNKSSLEILNNTKSRNDNSKLAENLNFLNKMSKVEFEKNIENNANKGISELIKIEDQELDTENQNDNMNITVIESQEEKVFTNEDLLSKVNCNEYDLIQIDFDDSLKIKGIKEEYIYAFENEFVNKLKNIVNIDRKQIGDNRFSKEISVDLNNKNLFNANLNDKTNKLSKFNTKQIENISLKIESQQFYSQKLNPLDRAENTTNEKNESTNFTTDINSNLKCEEKNNDLIEKFLNYENNNSYDFGNQVTFDEKYCKDNLSNSLNDTENDKINSIKFDGNSTQKSNSNIEATYLLSFTPRETSK